MVPGLKGQHPTAAQRNIISGNGGPAGFAAVIITGTNGGATGSGSVIQGNFIGTAVDGITPLPNNQPGISIFQIPGFVFTNVTVGGTTAGEGNVIAFNNGSGIEIFSGSGHSILSNSIFSNGGLGIDLSNVLPADGITSTTVVDSKNVS